MKIRDWWAQLRWHFSAERASQLEGSRLRERWLEETAPPDDQWRDERGEQR